MGEKRIAEQNGDISTVTARHSGPVAAQVRSVHDVVVNESGEVHHLHDRRRTNQRGFDRIGTPPATEENQRRPDAFSGDIETIFDGAANLGLETVELGSKKTIQFTHLRLEPKE
jgi:hypothetical protein